MKQRLYSGRDKEIKKSKRQIKKLNLSGMKMRSLSFWINPGLIRNRQKEKGILDRHPPGKIEEDKKILVYFLTSSP
jgi:hypothetical protein